MSSLCEAFELNTFHRQCPMTLVVDPTRNRYSLESHDCRFHCCCNNQRRHRSWGQTPRPQSFHLHLSRSLGSDERFKPPTIYVWDNVFSSEQCNHLHQIATTHEANRDPLTDDEDGFGESVSDIFILRNRLCDTISAETALEGQNPRNENARNDPKQIELTPLEHALNSVLIELGEEDGTVVEYWTRQEYLDLETHADIDEYELEEDGNLRYPAWGHVLYLKAGREQSEGRREDGNRERPKTQEAQATTGPTCVFPTKLGGWNVAHDSDECGENNDGTSYSTTPSTTPLVTVPVVPGRLLRFPGNAMHAVPKPVTKWLLSKKKQRELEWENDYDDDGMTDVRSVILFNTWKDSGPRLVSKVRYKSIDQTSDGIGIDVNSEVSCVEEDNQIPVGDDDLLEEVEDETISNEIVQCCVNEEWDLVFSHPNSSRGSDGYENQHGAVKEAQLSSLCENATNLTVGLMGTSERRLFPRKYAKLVSPTSVIDHLEDKYLPHKLDLIDLN